MRKRQSLKQRPSFASRWALAATALAAGTVVMPVAGPAAEGRGGLDMQVPVTPIKHVVVIFQENASFDHYFATYPDALNAKGDGTKFIARADTPTVNGLTDGNSLFPERLSVALHDFNPNTLATATPPGAPANPFRLPHDLNVTCSQNHNYSPEQLATDAGLMDRFPQQNNNLGAGCRTDGLTVMGYFDGNTVTALWNYAQRFALSDNSWGTNYGPSSPGAVNLVSGQTAKAVAHSFGGVKGPTGQLADSVTTVSVQGAFFVGPTSPIVTADMLNAQGVSVQTQVQSGTLIGDLDPYLDDCGNDKGATARATTVEMTGQNVGDLLNRRNVTWGWFAGGFRTAAIANPATTNAAAPLAGVSNDPFGTLVPGGLSGGQATGVGTASFGPATCAAAHVLHPDSTVPFDGPTTIHTVRTDYNPHHTPFQYYATTRNPHHLPPTSVRAIGQTDQANHNYDLLDFYDALRAHNLPAVSFLKAINRDDGHPGGESDPLSEQRFLVQTINALQASDEWRDTAVFIAWDDSDGWYDHVAPQLVNPSAAAGVDFVNSANGGNCGTPKADAFPARCGFGPRLPLVVVSPWTKVNYVDHNLSDQSSLLRFIEDNWELDYIDGPAKFDPLNGLRQPDFVAAPQKQSFDTATGSVDNMFDFNGKPHTEKLILDPVSGAVLKDERQGKNQGKI